MTDSAVSEWEIGLPVNLRTLPFTRGDAKVGLAFCIATEVRRRMILRKTRRKPVGLLTAASGGCAMRAGSESGPSCSVRGVPSCEREAGSTSDDGAFNPCGVPGRGCYRCLGANVTSGGLSSYASDGPTLRGARRNRAGTNADRRISSSEPLACHQRGVAIAKKSVSRGRQRRDFGNFGEGHCAGTSCRDAPPTGHRS
jgi:hypothetical protein